MKFQVLFALLTFGIFASCSSNRATAIPTVVTDLSTAMNNRDQQAFTRVLWNGAADYNSIQSGATQVSNLVQSGSYNYKYYFSNVDVPTTTAPITVGVDCVRITYLGTNFVSISNYARSTGSAKFEFVNAGTGFTEDWKVSKIYLPGSDTPVVKVPGFLKFTGP